MEVGEVQEMGVPGSGEGAIREVDGKSEAWLTSLRSEKVAGCFNMMPTFIFVTVTITSAA